MHLPPLLAAVERGDDRTALDLLDDVPEREFLGDDAVTLLAAAAHAGRDEVVRRLVEAGVDVTRPWAGGVDPVTWAADRGAYWVLLSLLARSGDPSATDGPHRRALRAARSAIDSGAAAEPGPPPAHRAIVTHLEAELGIRRSPDELMARALVHARPDHDDWFEALCQLGRRVDRKLFDWACGVVRDPSSLDHRRFGLDVLNFLTFGLDALGDDASDGGGEPPFAREAAEFLRPMLDTERDPHCLRAVIAAFGAYCSTGEVRTVLVHADHADPDVRNRVALELARAGSLVTADHPDVVAALVRLSADPVPGTRTTALHGLATSPLDTPELRDVMADHLTDPDLDARIEAAAGLALRGDERGPAVLDEVRRGLENHRSPGAGRLDDIRHVLRVRAEAAGRDG